MFKKLILAVLIIGGINWGLIGLLGFDLVAFIFGSSAALGARIAYIVVGVSALCTLPQLFGLCRGVNLKYRIEIVSEFSVRYIFMPKY